MIIFNIDLDIDNEDVFIGKVIVSIFFFDFLIFVIFFNIGESFDENFYLIENFGVVNVVVNGFFDSGFEYWLEFGFLEG